MELEALSEKITQKGDIETLGDDLFIIAQVNEEAVAYQDKLIITKTDNTMVYINPEGDTIVKTDYENAGVVVGDVKFATIGDGVTSIGDAAFRDCSSLSSVVIPDQVTSIGNDAFYGCSSLSSVVIPSSVTTMGIHIFEECSNLISAEFVKGVTSISNWTFQNC